MPVSNYSNARKKEKKNLPPHTHIKLPLFSKQRDKKRAMKVMRVS
jgi:hypothetical protein